MRRRPPAEGLPAALLSQPAWSRTASGGRPPRLLLRSSWQTVNIGDIAHTPGLLALLEKYLPETEVVLWPSDVGNGVAGMIGRRFPKVTIIDGKEAEKIFPECDFFLHGSGPGLVGLDGLARWKASTGKPYGIYAVTIRAEAFHSPGVSGVDVRGLLSGARFAYFRDTVSLEVAKAEGVACPLLAFAPDAAFATDLRDDARAEAFLRANDLQEGNFLCCIPRLRNTPYWKIKPDAPFDAEKHARNEALKEHDHAPLRQAIVEVARKTGMKILVCPEDSSQMEVGRELLVDPLPDDVRARVVWRQDYWLTAEALSTYVRSAGLFGNEMHSPILCVGNGIPAIVCRWEEQTSKGFMWRDIGLGEWLFTLDNEEEIPGIVPAILDLARDPAAAREKTLRARAVVQKLQAESMAAVARAAVAM